MNGNFNMGAYRDLERKLADALEADKTVHVKIDVIHSGDAARSDKFIVEYKIDGEPKRAVFRNEAGG